MSRLTVESNGPRSFRVEVQDAELLIRESFDFLLQREPATSIMSDFSLDVIEQYFPEYREEIGRRVS